MYLLLNNQGRLENTPRAKTIEYSEYDGGCKSLPFSNGVERSRLAIMKHLRGSFTSRLQETANLDPVERRFEIVSASASGGLHRFFSRCSLLHPPVGTNNIDTRAVFMLRWYDSSLTCSPQSGYFIFHKFVTGPIITILSSSLRRPVCKFRLRTDGCGGFART